MRGQPAWGDRLDDGGHQGEGPKVVNVQLFIFWQDRGMVGFLCPGQTGGCEKGEEEDNAWQHLEG